MSKQKVAILYNLLLLEEIPNKLQSNKYISKKGEKSDKIRDT
jgi:hypothetical protein